MNRTDRLYAIVEELRAVSPRPLSARRLAERFEVAVRTIERDLSALQQAGVPLWAEPGRTGGYVLDTASALPPVNFTAEEATAVAVALAHATSSPFAPASRTALLKLLAAMPAAQATAAQELVRRVRLMERVPDQRSRSGPRQAAPAVQRALADAVAARLVVEIDYEDKLGRPSTRLVEPVGLLSGEHGWYLLGRCRMREADRAFRLDRVRAVRSTKEAAPSRSLEELLGDVPGMRTRAPELH